MSQFCERLAAKDEIGFADSVVAVGEDAPAVDFSHVFEGFKEVEAESKRENGDDDVEGVAGSVGYIVGVLEELDSQDE